MSNVTLKFFSSPLEISLCNHDVQAAIVHANFILLYAMVTTCPGFASRALVPRHERDRK